MTEASNPSAAESYNAALFHPTVNVAFRHLTRKIGSFSSKTFISKLAQLPGFPDITAADLLSAARETGHEIKAYAVDADELPNLDMPILTYLRHGDDERAPKSLAHVEAIGQNKVTLAKGRFGHLSMPVEEFRRTWSGIVLVAQDSGERLSRVDELTEYRDEVRVIPDFLGEDSCQQLIAYCEQAHFRRSRVAGSTDLIGSGIVATQIRSSTTTDLPDRRYPPLAAIYAKCAELEGVSPLNIETIQGVRYKPGQRFKPHFDGGLGLPRLTTYLLYLNEDFEGGETYFPFLDMTIVPKTGSCLRFPSCDRNGRILWPSEHGGLPVALGTKYALNIWVRCPGVPAIGGHRG